jgi:hypothetical protein
MNRMSTTAHGAMARTTELTSFVNQGSMSTRDKVDALLFTVTVVVTQLLFRAAMLLRRWNY